MVQAWVAEEYGSQHEQLLDQQQHAEQVSLSSFQYPLLHPQVSHTALQRLDT